MKKFKIKHFINYALVGALLLFGVIMHLTGSLRPSTAQLFAQMGYGIILAVSLNLVVGFLGELSLGHAGFMCVGAYIGGLCAVLLKQAMPDMKLLVLIIAMLIGGAFAALFGFIIGLPSLRLKGDYLAIVTLAFGEIVRNIFMNQKVFGGARGLTTGTLKYDTRKEPTLFIVVFVVAIIMLILVQNLVKSKHGRAITAIRDNEIAAKAMGINVTFYKLFVFIVAAFFAGCAGVIYAHTTTPVLYSFFSYNYSIEILVMVVLGGMGSITGSIISAVFITGINFVLQSQLSGDLASLKNVVYAAILIVVVVFSNAPALKSFRERYSISAFMERFRKHDASDRKDDEAKWARVPTKIKMDALLSTDMAPDSDASIHGDISANDKGGNK
ncbi:MAG: branched-chain amino acid ABC transporter permease [Ruminococcaceae bacterium]|nr:branched-chain amino acid ABC transporter permease [Oscillospiraceae bacterium]